MDFGIADNRRRLHKTTVIATVSEIDWQKYKFRAKAGDILTNWLPMPAEITHNYKRWYPLREGAQVILSVMSGDLNTSSLVGMLWSDDVPVPDIPVADRPTTELIQFEDGTEIRYDQKKQLLNIATPNDLVIEAKTISLKSSSLTHNGKNVGDTHAHGGVMNGPSTTGTPI